MVKYETDVHFPSVAASQNPGVERYAVRHEVVEQMNERLADGSDVEASLDYGCKLSVTLEQDGDSLN